MSRSSATLLVTVMALAASACADTLKSAAHVALVNIKANECNGLPSPEREQCRSEASVRYEESQEQLDAFRREQAEERVNVIQEGGTPPQ